MSFLKVFEQPDNCDDQAGGFLSAAGRAAAFCVLVILFMLTVYTLW